MSDILNGASSLLSDLINFLVEMIHTPWITVLGIMVICAYVVSIFKRLT